MKMKEAEQQTGLSKQTLIWYEKEGLIHPARNENRYREYSDQDIKTLRLIKTLRDMNISIDDIRQILENHLSLEEVFEQQKAHLEAEEKRVRETGEQVRFYADTKAPVMEGLSEMYRPKTDWIGRKQPAKPFCIGTCPDKKLLKRLLFWNALWLFVLLFLCVFFLRNFQNVWGFSLPSFFLPQVAAAAVIFSLFGFGVPQIGLMSAVQRYASYAELSREGISYVKADTFMEKMRFLRQSFQNRDALTFVPYEQIEKAVVSREIKYIRLFTPFAHELAVTSITFFFRDETRCTLLHKLFNGNDEEIILRILKGHVGEVQDLRPVSEEKQPG